MLRYRCSVCNYIYDEIKENKLFIELSKDWKCPVCNSLKKIFIEMKKLEKIKYVEEEKGSYKTGEIKHVNEEKGYYKTGEIKYVNQKKGSYKIGEIKDFEEKIDSYKTVSDVLVEQMVAWGIKYIFGIPGTSSLGIVEAVRKNKDIKYFQVRHEQTAAMMASAYGKLTGNIAACLTIAGPGATNLATGLYDAKLDKSPVLVITGHVERKLIGTKAFQEINQHEFFEPICVFNKTITHQDEVTRLTSLAIKHALIEKGVSHISVSADIQNKRCYEEILDIEGRIATLSSSISEDILKKAVDLINSAKRPVIVAGFGALENKEDIAELAMKISAPVTTAFKGKGVLDNDNPYFVGPHGAIGTAAAHHLTDTTDLLIIIGCSCSNNTNIPNKPAIQIDIDPIEIGKRHPIDISLIGNSAEIVPKLIDKVEKSEKTEYLREVATLKEEWNETLKAEEDPNKSPLKFPYIMKELSKHVERDAIISIDVGENGWRVGRNFQMKKTQELLMSGYLATMGFGLPGAIAAQIINPEQQVICITGDGGFAMVMGDFLTAVKYELPVKVFVFNNHELGMIRAEQKNQNYPNWNTDLYNCDFAEFADSCGGVGLKAKNSEELIKAIKTAFKTDGPVIVDMKTDPNSYD